MANRRKPKESKQLASARSVEDFNHDRQALDSAHVQNESSRDAFLGLAHTAIFAASISFVGDVTPLGQAILKPVLAFAWFLGVIGLVSLTCSFYAARLAIDKHREALNNPVAPDAKLVEFLNGAALWTFPVAVLCIFVFVTANLFHMTHETPKPPAAPVVIKKGAAPPPRAPSHGGPPTPWTGVIPAPRSPAPAPTPAPPAPKK